MFGILLLIIGVTLIIFNYFLEPLYREYDTSVIEPCIDGEKGEVVSEELLCEHEINNAPWYIEHSRGAVFFFFFFSPFMGAMLLAGILMEE